MYKINTHNISGERNYVNNPDSRVVMTNYVCIISRRVDVVWPPRGCDLTPFDYYLWGAVKDKCYADKPETIHALEDNIREAISEIQLHTNDNVLKNWTDYVGCCMTSRGSHLNEIIFHYLPKGL